MGEIEVRAPSTHTDALLTTSTGATLRLASSSAPLVATFVGAIAGAQSGDLVLAQDFAAGTDAVWAFTGNPLTWAAGLLTSGALTSQTPILITEAADKGVDGTTSLFRCEANVTHEDGSFIVAGGGRVENRAVWEVQGDPDYQGDTGKGTFVNEAGAILRKTAGSGATIFAGGGLAFENRSTVSVESGELDVDCQFDHQTGALIQGTGTFDISGATFSHSGDTAPGLSPGILAWQGAYAMESSSTLHIEIVDDSGAGTGHDLLAVTGDADLSLGILEVTGTPGICNTPPCDYTILTCTGGIAGRFAQEVLPPNATVIYPGDPTGVPGEVFIRVDIPVPVELSFLDARREGERVLLSWRTGSGSSSIGFEVQRAAEGGDFAALRFVHAHDTTHGVQSYRYEDLTPPTGTGQLRYRLKQIHHDGTFAFSPIVEVEAEVALAPPPTYALRAAVPNPFNPQTTIRYDLPRVERVRLTVYDVAGRPVALLVDAVQAAGQHEAAFDAVGLASGTYLYELQTDSFRQARRMVLLK
jgi:hypothetical protein